MYKSNTPLFCRCCGKPIRKWTTTVYVEDAPSAYHKPSTWCRYEYGTITDKASCQRRSNQIVVSLKYHDGKVRSFNEWDGESYLDDLFCGTQCAASFGRGAARKGAFTSVAWRDAVDRANRRAVA